MKRLKFLFTNPFSSLTSSSRISQFSSITSSSSSSSPSPFIVDYLIQSLGISRDIALNASKRLLHIKTPHKPNSVLSFLRSIGLTQSQISSTVLRRPLILTSNVETNLLPKIKLFESLGATGEELADLVASSAVCLGNSVQGRLIPAINFLRQILQDDDQKVRRVIKKCAWVLTNDPNDKPSKNLNFLREKGLSSSSISSLVYKSPIVLLLKFEHLISVYKTVEEMGFNPKDFNFADALQVVIIMPKEKFSRKLKILNSYGFENTDVAKLYRALPSFFRSSDEYMKRNLDFFMNEVGYDVPTFLKYCSQLRHSLGRKMMPRYNFIRVLQSKGLVPDEVKFHKIFIMNDNRFIKEYVDKFKDELGSESIEAYKDCTGGTIEEYLIEEE